MPSDPPLVTVGMPSYNKAAYLAEAIESILAQTYPNFELLISDDRSTDDSAAICRGYADRDPRVRFVLQPTNLGMIANFDYVLDEARGERFMWFSADDRVDPEWLATCVAAGGAIGFGRVAAVDEDGSIKRRYPLSPVAGPRWRRMVFLYWRMMIECNFLHGVTATERIRRRGGLAPFAFAGQAFDFPYVWEAALDGELRAVDGPWLYKRDSPNNGVLQRAPLPTLLGQALWPALPIRRVLYFHRTRLPLGYHLLLAAMFVPRCVYAIAQWYAKGFGVARDRLRSTAP